MSRAAAATVRAADTDGNGARTDDRAHLAQVTRAPLRRAHIPISATKALHRRGKAEDRFEGAPLQPDEQRTGNHEKQGSDADTEDVGESIPARGILLSGLRVRRDARVVANDRSQ
jgi:hypothetical protein